ncbi:MAG: hypothetical protein DWH80_13715 [Planctomycetota bacterium]|nr:MAG: hypothetical protein DWH72_01370 [Planctomycetota bacterium]RLS29635.1 MAG: hypothetical protein DWH80_13715 [Planctomycetota bacterium]
MWSRSPAHLLLAFKVFTAGNIYFNRGITGPIGESSALRWLSNVGDWKKSRGPEYLLQCVVGKTIPENTMRWI